MSGYPSYYRRSLVQPGTKAGTAATQEAPVWPDLNQRRQKKKKRLTVFSPSFTNQTVSVFKHGDAFNPAPVLVLKELRLVGLAKGLLLSLGG